MGYFLYTVVLFLQGIFSGGVGSLAVYVLTLLFGASKIETMATRRAIVAVLSPITVVALSMRFSPDTLAKQNCHE